MKRIIWKFIIKIGDIIKVPMATLAIAIAVFRNELAKHDLLFYAGCLMGVFTLLMGISAIGTYIKRKKK